MSDAPPDILILDSFRTPIGEALVALDRAGVLRAFNWRDYEAPMRAWIARRYPAARLAQDKAPAPLRAAFDAYFAGDLGALEAVPWRASGTPFQLRVWNALCTIPAGETLSYGALATRVGNPSAVRAVGLANGANPLAVVVPCHRVIGADGTLTGYGGGLSRKRWLLTHESTMRSGGIA
jgi:methylated-DNA-[protein]-cysteine S-methyltransferase